MCQIFAGKSNKIRATLLNTPGLLLDLFTSNSDGLGAMYATSKSKLRIPKCVPHTMAEARAFIAQLPDDERNLVLHFRMKTSGHIDHDNAHPFVVLENEMAMTHNGILSISTKDDLTKCDTRHYIEKVLRPQLQPAPGLAKVTQWLDLIGDDISRSNRFVFMNNLGEMSFVNRDTGIEHDGMWIANTYSFDASLLIPGYKKSFSLGSYKGYKWDEQDDLYDTIYGTSGTLGNNSGVHLRKGKWEKDLPKSDEAEWEEEDEQSLVGSALFSEDDVWEALASSDPHELADYLLERPWFTLRSIMDECMFTVGGTHEFSKDDERIVKALVDGDIKDLVYLATFSDNYAMQVAQVMCWYGDWSGKPINANEEKDNTPFTPSQLVDLNLAARSAEANKLRLVDSVAQAQAQAEVQEELRLELLAQAAGEATASDYAG